MERRPDGTVGITRQELHELVWAKPRREVAASMGVTDFLLADACRKAGVPTPPAGHWTKVSMGKDSEPIPLPPAPEGVQELVAVGRAPKPSVPVEDRKPLLPMVQILDELKDPHALVAEAHASLARQAAAGDTTLLWRKTGCFHINVGTGSMDRALRILDAVLKAIEAKGHRATPGKWKWRVTMGAAHIGMRLEADYEQVPRKPKADDLKWMLRSPGWRPPATERIPTSSLTLRMEGYGYGLRKTFSDGKRQSLESLAPEIFVAPRSKQYHSPLGSASAGVSSPSIRQISMKCSCAAERSFSSAAFHFLMNCSGVIPTSPPLPVTASPHGSQTCFGHAFPLLFQAAPTQTKWRR